MSTQTGVRESIPLTLTSYWSITWRSYVIVSHHTSWYVHLKPYRPNFNVDTQYIILSILTFKSTVQPVYTIIYLSQIYVHWLSKYKTRKCNKTLFIPNCEVNPLGNQTISIVIININIYYFHRIYISILYNILSIVYFTRTFFRFDFITHWSVVKSFFIFTYTIQQNILSSLQSTTWVLHLILKENSYATQLRQLKPPTYLFLFRSYIC